MNKDLHWTKAMELAQEGHQRQAYGDKSYEYHLGKVVNTVMDLNGIDSYSRGDKDNNNLIAVSWCHDLLEDQEEFFNDNINLFSDQQCEAIKAISKRQDETRKTYLGRCMANPIALKVKRADTLSNLTESIKSGDTRRIKKYTRQLEVLHNV